jgi:uncharacterized protein (DUF2267 family)
MRITKRLVQTAGLAAGVIGGVAAAAPESPVGRAARRLADRLTRDVRYAASRAPGIVYGLAGRRPDPDVSDDTVADRVRSSLGPLEKRLDVPRVHVMVDDHVVIVHGDVPDEHDAETIEQAIMRVSGVVGVESHLHAGLTAGETRPSQGATAPRPPSEALRALLDAARDAGAGSEARAATHAVLCAFTDRVPQGEREQVLAHLPADVRALAGPVRRHGELPSRVKTLPQLLATVMLEGGIAPEQTEGITRAVVAVLRRLVPEEAGDVAAVLPPELRELWQSEPAR